MIKILKLANEIQQEIFEENDKRLLTNLEIYLSGLKIIPSQDENIDYEQINDFQQLKME